MHSDEGFLEVVEGGGVQHLLLDLGRVRAPVHQEQLLFLRRLCCALVTKVIAVQEYFFLLSCDFS